MVQKKISPKIKLGDFVLGGVLQSFSDKFCHLTNYFEKDPKKFSDRLDLSSLNMFARTRSGMCEIYANKTWSLMRRNRPTSELRSSRMAELNVRICKTESGVQCESANNIPETGKSMHICTYLQSKCVCSCVYQIILFKMLTLKNFWNSAVHRIEVFWPKGYNIIIHINTLNLVNIININVYYIIK